MVSAISIVVQVSRMSDGSRKVVSISEITGMEENVVSMQDIFLFEKKGVGPTGKVRGRFYATGIVPKCADKLTAAGATLPVGLADHSVDIG